MKKQVMILFLVAVTFLELLPVGVFAADKTDEVRNWDEALNVQSVVVIDGEEKVNEYHLLEELPANKSNLPEQYANLLQKTTEGDDIAELHNKNITV